MNLINLKTLDMITLSDADGMPEKRMRALADTTEFQDVSQQEVDDMLLREYMNASEINRKADVQRLKLRATDKVLAEFKLLGYRGFKVTEVDNEVYIEGVK